MVLPNIDSIPGSIFQHRDVRQDSSRLLDDMERDFEDEYNRLEFEPRFDFSRCQGAQRTTADEYFMRGRRVFREYRYIEANSDQDVLDVLDGTQRFIPLYAPGSGMTNWYLYRSHDGKFWFAVRSVMVEDAKFAFKRMSRKQIRGELLSEYDSEPDPELPPVIFAEPLPDEDENIHIPCA